MYPREGSNGQNRALLVPCKWLTEVGGQRVYVLN